MSSETKTTKKILHVVESYGGGVATAISSYISSLEREGAIYEHHLLLTVREQDFRDDGQLSQFASVERLPSGIFNAISTIRKSVDALEPDIVHAHSSFAGVYSRLGLALRAIPVVYTPHCFAFERRDLHFLVRGALFIAEGLLAIRKTYFAACSDREASLARRLSPCAVVVVVPNVTAPNVFESAQAPQKQLESILVSGAGRLAKQKDPDFFIEVCKILKDEPKFRAVWVGGGNPEIETRMQDAGIAVTGWLPQTKALQQLAESDIYLHTARWEGFPMALLESQVLGVATVVREIPALAGVSAEWVGKTPAEIAAIVIRLPEDGMLNKNREYWASFLNKNNQANQARALIDVYSTAVAKGRSKTMTVESNLRGGNKS